MSLSVSTMALWVLLFVLVILAVAIVLRLW